MITSASLLEHTPKGIGHTSSQSFSLEYKLNHNLPNPIIGDSFRLLLSQIKTLMQRGPFTHIHSNRVDHWIKHTHSHTPPHRQQYGSFKHSCTPLKPIALIPCRKMFLYNLNSSTMRRHTAHRNIHSLYLPNTNYI
jgi:hypothetical protein